MLVMSSTGRPTKAALASRQQVEKCFHDTIADGSGGRQTDPEKVFADVSQSDQAALSLLGELEGRKLLDIGCGLGDYSVYFALRGAQVYAIDLSEGMVRQTEHLAEEYGVGDALFVRQMDAEALDFPDESFDIIWGKAVLHHLDIPKARDELARCLVPGGIAVLSEPLGHNPLANAYRYVATRVHKIRTPTEHALTYQDIDLLRLRFADVECREFVLVSSLLFAWHYFKSVVTGAELSPFWVNSVRTGRLYPRATQVLDRVDAVLLRTFPFLSRCCNWIVFKCTK